MSLEAPFVAEEFRSFWLETIDQAEECPVDYVRRPQSEFEYPGFLVESLEFRSSSGSTLFGWIAYQAGAFNDPGFLWIAPYGQESMLPNKYGTRQGCVSLSFNFHGNPAFHQEKYIQARGYFANGADDPEHWIFRSMFKDAVIAAKILRSLPETGSSKLGAMGMSQGGGMAIWLGAWCSLIGVVCSDMPFLGNIVQTLKGKVYRYPQKELLDYADQMPLGMERVLNTVAFYDTAYHAQFCEVPTQVSMGLRDPASRPEQVQAIYDAIAGKKRLQTYDWGHDWYDPMIENNLDWLLQNSN